MIISNRIIAFLLLHLMLSTCAHGVDAALKASSPSLVSCARLIPIPYTITPLPAVESNLEVAAQVNVGKFGAIDVAVKGRPDVAVSFFVRHWLLQLESKPNCFGKSFLVYFEFNRPKRVNSTIPMRVTVNPPDRMVVFIHNEHLPFGVVD